MDKYRLLNVIGRGVSGEVFEVEEKATGQHLVAKRIPITGASDEERQRVAMEVKVLRLIDHPNIVRYKESFLDSDTQIIIMEKCETALDVVIAQHTEAGTPFPAALLIEWMAELLCAIETLHSKGIMHRDISTKNIFTTKRNHVKLGDFGVCKVFSSTNGNARTFVGTPYYVAPEVIQGDTYDFKTDVWSLGVVFYELCTLRRPFEGGNLMAVINSISNGSPEPFGPDVDPRFWGIVESMLRRDPASRPSAREILNEHLVVPETHPSHQSQDPEYSRRVQQEHGPAYQSPPVKAPPKHVDPSGSVSQFDRMAGWTGAGPPARATPATKAKSRFSNNSGNGATPPSSKPVGKKTAPVVNASPAKHKSSQPSSGNTPPPAPANAAARAAPSTPLRENASSPQPLSRSPVVASAGGGATRAQGHNGSFRREQPNQLLLSPDEHQESLQRIKNATARVNVAELRRQQQRAAEAAAAAGGSGVLDPSLDVSASTADETNFVVFMPRAANKTPERPSSAPNGAAKPSGSASPTPSPQKAACSTEGGESPQAATPQSNPKRAGQRSASGVDDGGIMMPMPSAASPTAAVPASASPPQQRHPDAHPSLPAAVMALVRGWSGKVTLDDLDAVAEALLQYKVERFGMQ